MSESAKQTIAGKWTRLGVLFNVAPWRQTPDLERLLLETAAELPNNPRLLPLAVTWLSRYGRLVARHRLARMAAMLTDANSSAALGLLLDTAASMSPADAFDIVKSTCRPAVTPRPLFIVDRASPGLAAFARARASRLSKRWNLWADPVELKPEALRPLDWVLEKNPSLQMRAVFSGNLRASILACLEYDSPAGASEAQLARLCGVTRKALHEALDHLELCSLTRRTRPGRDYHITLKRPLFRIAG